MRTIIKPDREEDLYVEWSVAVDGITWIGTRKQALAAGAGPTALDRADAFGTSWADGTTFGWDDPGLVVEMRWWLPRANLLGYVNTMLEEREGIDLCNEDLRLQRFLESPEENPHVVRLVLDPEGAGE